jgi:hypothetical protein
MRVSVSFGLKVAEALVLCCPFWCVDSEAAAAAAVAAATDAVVAGILPPGVLFSQGLLSGQLAAQVILERTR